MFLDFISLLTFVGINFKRIIMVIVELYFTCDFISRLDLTIIFAVKDPTYDSLVNKRKLKSAIDRKTQKKTLMRCFTS